MQVYKSKKSILLLIDLFAIAISYLVALGIRYNILVDSLGSVLIVPTYIMFFAIAVICYIVIFCIKDKLRIERKSYQEIIYKTLEEQIVFIVIYVLIFFVFKQANIISRMVVGTFFVGNIVLCSLFRILYHNYCVNKTKNMKNTVNLNEKVENESSRPKKKQHVYIIGSKSIGQYGGYESFVMNLLQQHENNQNIKYHVACKANGDGYMNLSKLSGVTPINDDEFTYCNAHCFMIKVPEKIGSAQAIYYDLAALNWCCNHIEKNHIENPIVYILASRVGPFEKKYVERIHDANGKVFQNPDGWEHARKKWNYIIRRYWKLSERYAVKYADLVVCDSKHIEEYIKDEYSFYQPATTFIAYGSHIHPSTLSDTDVKYTNWLADHDLTDGEFYISVGRFVPENNFEIMIREFMSSNSKKDFAIITTENGKYAAELQQKLQYKKDKRIKFVGTVYDTELLTKIRENAYGYFHGHSVGGTNPSLLEAMGATKLNLLFDVGFNREVAEDAALYWSAEEGNLARLIDKADTMVDDSIAEYGKNAKTRIQDEYSWAYIAKKYEDVFV